MNVFIDTNVFLTFFHFSAGDIEELHKIVALLKADQLTLWVPEQVTDEFRRNREVRLADAARTLPQSLGIKLPAYFRTYPEYDELMQHYAKINEKYLALRKTITEDSAKLRLKADVLIDDIFIHATTVKHDKRVVSAALERLRLGNPPGKKGNTIGDEVNWETLLKAVPDGEDLIIVSGDGDYASPLDSVSINSFLAAEWKSKKLASLVLFTSLSPFFRKHFPEIKLAADVEKAVALSRLAKSSTFVSTHLAVKNLEQVVDYLRPDEVDKMIEIMISNDQVGWIIGDDDVRSLYEVALKTPGVSDGTKKKFVAYLLDRQLEDETFIDYGSEVLS